MFICGIDEAGRGPLAGPVCAAAVILGDKFPLSLLNDSKKLPPSKREELQRQICHTINVAATGSAATAAARGSAPGEGALAWGIGWASHTEIDNINILRASLLAMKRAFEEMAKNYPFLITEDISAIVDGIHIPDITGYSGYSISCKAMVKADAKVPEVMAASILAKTARDNYMYEMSRLYPQYGYEKHKGYPTKTHKELIRKYGPSPIQRMSFKY